MESRRINWLQIIIIAVITSLITPLIVGIILYKVQAREPELTYNVIDTQPFAGKDRNFAIYNVMISNSGKTQISNVLTVIQIPSATIEDMKFTSDLSLKYTSDIAGDILNLHIPEFNPNDIISVSVLANSISPLPTKPKVSARGTGIVGVQRGVPNEDLSHNIISISTISGFVVLIVVATTMLLSTKISAGHTITHGKHSEDQNEVLAYLCGLHNLNDEAKNYLSRPRRASYWAEADRFAAIAIANSTNEQAENIEMLLKDLLRYAAINKGSTSIIYYDIARIEFARGHSAEAGRYLKEARKYAGKLIDIRLKIDSNLRNLLEQDVDSHLS